MFECLARQLRDRLALSGGSFCGAVSDGGCDAEGDLRRRGRLTGQGGAAGGATYLFDDAVGDLVAKPEMSVPADEENGLDQGSFLMVDKMTTVSRSDARTVVGRSEATALVEFERRLLVFFGFGA